MLTNEKTVLWLFYAGLPHGFLVHSRIRLADQWLLSIVAESESVKEIVDAQKSNYPLAMRLVSIGEEPHGDLALVNVLKQCPKLRIGLDNSLQGESIVHLGVVVKGVNLVVSHEALDGEPIAFVVLLVQRDSLLKWNLKVLGEVLVNELGHQIMDFGT